MIATKRSDTYWSTDENHRCNIFIIYSKSKRQQRLKILVNFLNVSISLKKFSENQSNSIIEISLAFISIYYYIYTRLKILFLKENIDTKLERRKKMESIIATTIVNKKLSFLCQIFHSTDSIHDQSTRYDNRDDKRQQEGWVSRKRSILQDRRMKLNERARGSDVTAAAERAGRVDDERRELRTDLNTIRSGFNRNRATKPIARCKQKRDGGGSEMDRGEGRCMKREGEREPSAEIRNADWCGHTRCNRTPIEYEIAPRRACARGWGQWMKDREGRLGRISTPIPPPFHVSTNFQFPVDRQTWENKMGETRCWNVLRVAR